MSKTVNGQERALRVDPQVCVCAICEWPFGNSFVGLSCVGHVGVNAYLPRSRDLPRSVIEKAAAEHRQQYGR